MALPFGAQPGATDQEKQDAFKNALNSFTTYWAIATVFKWGNQLVEMVSTDPTVVTLGVNSVALKVTICCTAVLYMKMLCTLLIQGGKRIIAGSRPEEDQALLPDFGTQSLLDAPVAAEDTEKREAKEIEARWIRLVSNDTENIPMGLIAAWGSLFCAYSQPWHVGLLLAFTVARVGHTFAYANAKQPHRVFAYMVGVLATLGMCANGVAGALLA